MNEELLTEAIELINRAAWTLHDVLYPGNEVPAELRADIPFDATGDLIGVLHDVIHAEKKLHNVGRNAAQPATV